MAKFTKSLFLAASALGLASLFAGSAQAGSITGATPGSSDYKLYCADATNTYDCTGSDSDADSVLAGDATSPGGNVELRAASDTTFGPAVTLAGTLNGEAITFSSLTKSDWDVFGKKWLTQLMLKYTTISGITETSNSYYALLTDANKARFSDPNISYVNQDDATGEVSIGLAGHFNAASLLPSTFSMFLRNEYKGVNAKPIQISEIVKYTYDGVTDYLWSFEATNSGLVEAGDEFSHSGNYEVAFQGKVPPTESVPEPASILGLMAVGSLIASRKRK
jgi:hypothetical protein